MTQDNFHIQSEASKPPPRLLPVLEKSKTMYKKWVEIHRNIERTVKFGLGAKIDNLFIELLELLRKSVYTPANKKIVLLEEASNKIDSSRFFLQLLWEMRLVSNKQYILLETDIQDLGKIVGGWKKGLLSKTSAFVAEERKQ